jgi:hypothetical protein
MDETHDAGMTFVYDGDVWIINLYSPTAKIDCGKLVELFGGVGTPTQGTFVTDDINKLFKKNLLIKVFLRHLLLKLLFLKILNN